MSVQDDIWENSREGIGACSGCHKAGGEHNHPGFFNYSADVLIVEEAPSPGHFIPGYDRSKSYAWYREFFEEEEKDETLRSWDFFTEFLRPVWKPLGFDDDEIFDEVYMTSGVKCPLKTGVSRQEKVKDWRTSFERCQSYLEREIREMDPDVIITAGVPATDGTAKLLGVPKAERRRLKISKPSWWGLSKFPTKTDPPMIHMPLWFYYSRYNRLTDEQWAECLSAVRDGLRETVY